MYSSVPIARALLIDDAQAGCFHVISRCVRRAFLCGDEAEHRREWVRELIKLAAGSFSMDVLAYAVMANHLHLVVRTDPTRVILWTPAEIAERWAAAHPRLGPDGEAIPWPVEEIIKKSRDAEWIAKTRDRLRSLSWFMKCVKERLARRANRADHCTGHFWEGRFRSVPLLDQTAVLAAMAYVDLNPVRAAITETPEDSDYTSVQDRCRARQSHRAAVLVPSLAGTATHDEAGLWFAGIDRATIDGPAIISVDEYLELVDATGRIVRSGKRGSIPAHLVPILERLDLDLNAWMKLMASGGHFAHGSFGKLASRAAEAIRRGVRWLIDQTAGLYRPEPDTA